MEYVTLGLARGILGWLLASAGIAKLTVHNKSAAHAGFAGRTGLALGAWELLVGLALLSPIWPLVLPLCLVTISLFLAWSIRAAITTPGAPCGCGGLMATQTAGWSHVALVGVLLGCALLLTGAQYRDFGGGIVVTRPLGTDGPILVGALGIVLASVVVTGIASVRTARVAIDSRFFVSWEAAASADQRARSE